MAETHLARAHDMYKEERYILAGRHLELALAGAYLVRTHSVNQTITRSHRVCVCVCVCVFVCVLACLAQTPRVFTAQGAPG